jgi:hypothetical protein
MKQILIFGVVHQILSFAIFFLLKFLANLPNNYNLLPIMFLGIMISSTAIVIGYPVYIFIEKKFFKPSNDVLINYDIKYIYATIDNNEGIVKVEFKANYLDFYLKGSKEYEQYKEIAIKNNQQ